MPLALALPLTFALAAPLPAAEGHGQVYALVDARLEPADGPALEHATLVIRGGLIEAVGADVKAPPDARVLDAKGLTLTPGLIDALGSIGLPEPKKGETRDGGISPETRVIELVKAPDAAKAREAGVTTALVAPHEGVLPGRSVLLDLAGDDAAQMALRQPAALHLHLQPQPRGYPSSLMGVVALARQQLLDAQRYARAWSDYEKAPLGKSRPRYDAGLEAWQDVLSGRLPLFVTAPRENDLRRALRLRDEFGIRIVAADAREASAAVELLRKERLPLIVGVDFDPPRSPEWGGLDEERERRKVDEAERAPARLHAAGIPFALASGWSRDFLAGVRKAIDRGLPREAALRSVTLSAAEVLGVADRTGSLTPGKLANVVAWTGTPLTPEAAPRWVFVDGLLFEPEPKTEKGEHGRQTPADTAARDSHAAQAPPLGPAPPAVPAPAAVEGALAIVGATIWTGGPQGTLENATLVIRHGKVAAVGAGLRPPDGARVIEGRGRFVMPGIIDEHSHTAIEGEVNECTDIVTAEVRVGDVIDHRDPDLYRQLAGGVTTIHVLHGSCNAIGGQNAVLKLRWGQGPEGLLFEGAPRSIKFALGENPKRSNFRNRERRYPATRMGVEAVLRQHFEAARAYAREWDEYGRRLEAAGKGPAPVPPRRDLRLETLRDVLAGKIDVHAHCYRADEILMLIRLADEFGFRIKTFEHVLEGYKVASEIARHGAGAGTFIDWWGFKLEAYDAIPYNPAVLQSKGVVVALNSDSSNLARRLYWDAAKAVKYGVSEDEALRMITINPARLMGIDGRVGSLEVGKDADVAVFSTHPFSPDTRVEMTLVDGRVYFDRAADLERRGEAASAAAPEVPASAPGTARADAKPALSGGETVALVGGRVVPVSGPLLERGTVVISGGRIAAVGADVEPPPGARVVDVSGQTVYPGLIDASNSIGLVEIDAVSASVDTTEIGDVNPQAQAWVALNPHSAAIPVARAGGVTTALSAPRGGLVSGQSAVVHLAGTTPDEMTLLTPAALQVVFPSGEPARTPGGDEPEPKTLKARLEERRQGQDKQLRRLAGLLAEARAHAAGVEAAAAAKSAAPPPDVLLEALAPAAQGRVPVMLRAEREADIRAAVAFAQEQGLRLIVSGGLEAWRCAELLREKDVPVLLSVLELPARESDAYDAAYTNAARLQEAGVRFAIVTDSPADARNLPHHAAMARAFGLPADAALRAITQSPAEILGLGERLGTLEPGKDADVVVADGDILDVRSQVTHVFVAGREQSLETRHTRLWEQFRGRP